MRVFLVKTILFSIIIGFLLTIGLFALTNSKTLESGIAAFPLKEELLKKHNGPSIIFIGGSNLSFGLNSKRISESFHRPVINMGLHAGIGLRFMIKSTEPFIGEGDVVVLSTEYEDYYNNHYYGNIETVGLIFDIDHKNIKYLSFRQWHHLFLIMTKYASINLINLPASAYKKYFKKKQVKTVPSIYDIESFNDYGDTFIHWNMPNQDFLPAPRSVEFENINPDVISELLEFKNTIEERGACLIILPPVYQETSYRNQNYIISKITDHLISAQIPFDSKPMRYAFADSLFFNTRYHLNKEGIEIRTTLVIEDVERVLEGNKFIYQKD